jgi:hypothetical protein
MVGEGYTEITASAVYERTLNLGGLQRWRIAVGLGFAVRDPEVLTRHAQM